MSLFVGASESYDTDAWEAYNLKKENAKLRELVADMWREGAFSPGACYEKAVERLEERTRELGIGVN